MQIQLIFKIKMIILSIYNVNNKTSINNPFCPISNECSKIVNCEKTNIYLIDFKT